MDKIVSKLNRMVTDLHEIGLNEEAYIIGMVSTCIQNGEIDRLSECIDSEFFEYNDQLLIDKILYKSQGVN